MDVGLIEPLGVSLGPAWRVARLVGGLCGARPAAMRSGGRDPRAVLELAQWYTISEQPRLVMQTLDRLERIADGAGREQADGAVLRADVLSGFTGAWADHPGDAWGVLSAVDVDRLPGGSRNADYLLTTALTLLADARMAQARDTLTAQPDDLSAGVPRALWLNAQGLWHLRVGDGQRAADAFREALDQPSLPDPLWTRLRINLASAHVLEGEPEMALAGYRFARNRLRREPFGARTRGVLAFNAATALTHCASPFAPRLALRRAEQAIWLLDAAQGVRAEHIWAQLLVATQLRTLGLPEADDAFRDAERLADDTFAPQVVAHIDMLSGERHADSGDANTALNGLVPALLLAMSGRYDVPGLASRAALLRIRVEPLFERVLSLAHAGGRDQLAAELIAFHHGAAVRDVAASTSPAEDASLSRPAPPVVIDGRCELDAYVDRAARRYGLRRAELVGPEAITLVEARDTPLEARPDPTPITLINTLKGRFAFAPPGQDTLIVEPGGDGRFWLKDGPAPETEVVTINGVRIPIRAVGPQQAPTDLPEPAEGILYLVSQVMARALAGRRDLVYPYYVDRDRSFATGLARATRADGEQR